jgi:hypothetical protein
MLQFLRKSKREIHGSFESYISREIIIPCRSCERCVPIRVIRVLLEPDKAVQFKCNHCNQVVGFTTRSPQARTYSPPPNHTPVTPFELDSAKRVVYGDPVSIGSQIYIAETGHAASRNSNSHNELRDDPEPSPPPSKPYTFQPERQTKSPGEEGKRVLP